MLVRLHGEAKNYPWGSTNLIQDHFGVGEHGAPLAEVWFGTHPAGESRETQSNKKLSELIEGRLSFLAKFLAAGSPLSIQVHPNSEQAKEGFAREQALGLDLFDPKRNYRDESNKPEILIALSPFSALCGFRPRAELEDIFLAFSESEDRFGELTAKLATGAHLEEIFSELLLDLELPARFGATVGKADLLGDESSLVLQARDLALELLDKHPADSGAMVALMLNRVELSPGEAIFLPAGNLHAYLSGLALEVMGASDNVIRGGLTQKHIDQVEIRKITDFSELLEPLVRPQKLAEGFFEYPVNADEFKVYRAELTGSNLLADLDLPAGAIVVCTAGEVAVSTSLEEREVLQKADVVYVSGAKKFSLSGSGTAFVVVGAA
ncbi:MAG: mannose-6-phosphate isomerase, class I [Rhodoluna sp.]